MGNCIHIDNCSICCCGKMPSPLDEITNAELKELLSERYEITFLPGEIIFKQGTELTHFACFRKGRIKVYFERSDGSHMLINVIKRGHLCESMGLYTSSEHHLTYQALTETTICFIPIKFIVNLMNKNNEMILAMLAQKQYSIINLTNKIANLTFKSTISRVADVLLFLKREIYKQKNFNLDLSRQDLADLAAMSKGSLIHSLKEIKDAGIIDFNNNEIKILKEESLIDLSYTGFSF